MSHELTRIFNSFSPDEWQMWFDQGGPLPRFLDAHAMGMALAAMQTPAASAKPRPMNNPAFPPAPEVTGRRGLSPQGMAERRRQIAKAVQAKGARVVDVARRFNVTRYGVYVAIREQGVKPPRKKVA